MPEPVPSSLAEALAALQGRLPRVAKDQTASVTSQRTGKTHSYRYADLLDVTEAMMPLLSALGLSFIARPSLVTIGSEPRFVLSYQLMHVSGSQVGGEYPLPMQGSPQEIGTAITYARRYALCAVTGLAPGGDDDDAASAEQAHHAAHQAARQPRNVPDAQLAASGQMTRAQKADHERLAADTVRDPKRAERTYPRAPDPDDPWAQDAPVDHERAAQLREDLAAARTARIDLGDDPDGDNEDRELPEDKPGTSSLAQQQAIAIELAGKGIGTREDKLAYCGMVTGREVASSKELSYNEAAAILKAARELEAVNA